MDLPFPAKDYGLTFRGAFKMRKRTLYNVYHHTDSGDKSAETIHQEHLSERDNWLGIGYNFLIRQDGTIEIGRPVWAQGAHAGPEINPISVGTCLTGRLHIFGPTEEQMRAAGVVHAGLELLYPGITVGLHKDFAPTECPGKFFDRRTLMAYIDKARAEMQASPEYEPWKQAGIEWLAQAGLIEAEKWKPTDMVDMGTLGVILARLGFEVSLNIKRRDE